MFYMQMETHYGENCSSWCKSLSSNEIWRVHRLCTSLLHKGEGQCVYGKQFLPEGIYSVLHQKKLLTSLFLPSYSFSGLEKYCCISNRMNEKAVSQVNLHANLQLSFCLMFSHLPHSHVQTVLQDKGVTVQKQMRCSSSNQTETYSKIEIIKSLIIRNLNTHTQCKKSYLNQRQAKEGNLTWDFLYKDHREWIYISWTHNSIAKLWKDTTYSHNQKQCEGEQDRLLCI